MNFCLAAAAGRKWAKVLEGVHVQRKPMVTRNTRRVRSVCGGMPTAAGDTKRTGAATNSTSSRADWRRERVDTDAQGNRRRQTRIPLRNPASRAGHEHV